MFNPVNRVSIGQEIAKIDWIERIYKLSNMYMFRFKVAKLISSSISVSYYEFIGLCLRFVTLKTYYHVIDQDHLQEVGDWNAEICEVSSSIKALYCQIINKIKKDKKIYIMDIMIFIITLLSRQFMSDIFQQTKKKEKGNNSDKKSSPKEVEDTTLTDEKNVLLIEQYTFIIVTYETTGNIVSPHCFEILRKKLTQRENPLQFRKKSQELIVESFKYIREHYEKKKTCTLKMRSIDAFQFEESIQSAFKIFDSYDHYEAKKADVKLNGKDNVSSSLNSLLESGHNKENIEYSSYTKLEKINQVSLSKAAKFNYNIVERDLSLLQRLKKKSESLNFKKHRQKYWRQIKSINKPIFHIKNRSNEEQCQSNKEETKNWVQILSDLKKKIKKSDVDLQKFKSLSYLYETKQKTSRSNSACLPLSKPEGPSVLPSIASQESQPSRASLLSKQSKFRKSLTHKICQKPRMVCEYKVKEFDQEEDKKTEVDPCKLKKRVQDARRYKKAFQEKCKARKSFLEQCYKI